MLYREQLTMRVVNQPCIVQTMHSSCQCSRQLSTKKRKKKSCCRCGYEVEHHWYGCHNCEAKRSALRDLLSAKQLLQEKFWLSSVNDMHKLSQALLHIGRSLADWSHACQNWQMIIECRRDVRIRVTKCCVPCTVTYFPLKHTKRLQKQLWCIRNTFWPTFR